MPTTIPLAVALTENLGILHWGLFIDTADATEKTVVQIIGARQKYFPQIRTPSDARSESALGDLIDLCEIDAAHTETIKNLAYIVPIRNHIADYSCQYFVLDLLDRLEEEGIVDGEDNEYKRRKEMLRAKRESWPPVG
ncbi:hypothetical protein BJY04DRAFT_193744 [Aspergillus karnatakaensis]|uniref:uncharacterized protein n=1 Tax=Aspergillus karnatakaensis TaxID=1810916 RepID=UPI003CCCD917